MYYLVDFEDGPQIVRESWLTEDLKTCSWPPWGHDLDQLGWDNAVRQHHEVQEDWTECPVLRVRLKAGNFQYIRRKLKDAENMSDTDIQTSNESKGISLRRRKAAHVESSSDSDNESLHVTQSKLQKTNRRKEKSSKNRCPPKLPKFPGSESVKGSQEKSSSKVNSDVQDSQHSPKTSGSQQVLNQHPKNTASTTPKSGGKVDMETGNRQLKDNSCNSSTDGFKTLQSLRITNGSNHDDSSLSADAGVAKSSQVNKVVDKSSSLMFDAQMKKNETSFEELPTANRDSNNGGTSRQLEKPNGTLRSVVVKSCQRSPSTPSSSLTLDIDSHQKDFEAFLMAQPASSSRQNETPSLKQQKVLNCEDNISSKSQGFGKLGDVQSKIQLGHHKSRSDGLKTTKSHGATADDSKHVQKKEVGSSQFSCGSVGIGEKSSPKINLVDKAFTLASSMTELEFRAYVISGFSNIKAILNTLSATKKKKSDSTDSSCDLLLELPADTMCEWEAFEKNLSQAASSSINEVVQEMKALKGVDAACSIRSMLTKVMTNRLASMFSFHGAKAKTAFKESYFYKNILLRTIKKLFKETADIEVCKVVESWLRLAAQRKGGMSFKKWHKRSDLSTPLRRSPRNKERMSSQVPVSPLVRSTTKSTEKSPQLTSGKRTAPKAVCLRNRKLCSSTPRKKIKRVLFDGKKQARRTSSGNKDDHDDDVQYVRTENSFDIDNDLSRDEATGTESDILQDDEDSD